MNGWNKNRCVRWLKQADSGSGTVLGLVIVGLVGVLASIIVCAGSYLICQSQAHTYAQQIALDAAFEQQIRTLSESASSRGSLCAQASAKLNNDDFKLASCTVDGEDVQVAVEGIPRVKFLPHPRVLARAGPAQCVPRNR